MSDMLPYAVTVGVVAAIFTWCIIKVYRMKQSFDDRGGSYKPISDMLIPDWLRKLK